MLEEREIFTSIEGLTDRVRLPRLGKIRLGVKVDVGTANEHPRDLDYFVVPEEVAKILNDDKPRELRIMFPIDDQAEIFPQALKRYGSNAGLKCSGNGARAKEMDPLTGQLQGKDCPCEHLRTRTREYYKDEDGQNKRCDCAIHATLNFVLPDVNIAGVYQIETNSINSIIDINSGMKYIRGILADAHGIGSLQGIYLKLVREATVVYPKTKKHPEGEKQIRHTLKLYPDFDLRNVPRLSDNAKTYFLDHKQHRLDTSPDNVADPNRIDLEAQAEPDPATAAAIEKKHDQTEEKLREWETDVDERMAKQDRQKLDQIKNWEQRYKDIDKGDEFKQIICDHAVPDDAGTGNPDNIHPTDRVKCLKALARRYAQLTKGKGKGGN